MLSLDQKPKRHRFPRVLVTDKLKSYDKPIKHMCKGTDHRKVGRYKNTAQEQRTKFREAIEIMLAPHQPKFKRIQCTQKIPLNEVWDFYLARHRHPTSSFLSSSLAPLKE